MSLTEIRRKVEKALRLWENCVCVCVRVCGAACVRVCVGGAVCVPTRITVTPGSLAATLPSRLL